MTGPIDTSVKHHRFEVLDSWRGICACMIVLFHFNNVTQSHLNHFFLLEHAYIFVDFFFVLSGFVISASYERKLREGFSIRNFILLRLGRIYPLHIFILLCYIALECSKFVLESNSTPFAPPEKGMAALGANILLVHALGFFDDLTWNGPSWSISVEFYAYIAYAFALLMLHRKIGFGAATLLVIAPLVFFFMKVDDLEFSYGLAFLRCLFGFATGILAFHAYGILSRLDLAKFKFYTVLEVSILVLLCLVMLTFSKSAILILCPYIFGLCVLLFALERGAISRMLKAAPLVFIGMLSYSIYMVHAFVLVCMGIGTDIVEKVLGIELARNIVTDGVKSKIYGFSLWQGDLWHVATLVIVIVASTLTFYIVERPANQWIRGYVARKSSQNP